MITIITNNNNYAIYDNNHKIIECINPINTFNNVIKNMGLNITDVIIKNYTNNEFPSLLNDSPLVENKNKEENIINKEKNQPCGNIDNPTIGDLVYIDGYKNILSAIIGGVGTITMISKENLIELEEIPGHYFNWNFLKSEQDLLKNKYGYKPVSII